MTLLIWRSVGWLHYPSCHVLLRPGPPGERAERFCGLQHPGPPDPLGLVRELQPALWGRRGRRARYVRTAWWMGCLHSSTVTDRDCQTHMLSNFSWKKKSLKRINAHKWNSSVATTSWDLSLHWRRVFLLVAHLSTSQPNISEMPMHAPKPSFRVPLPPQGLSISPLNSHCRNRGASVALLLAAPLSRGVETWEAPNRQVKPTSIHS